MAGKIEEDGMSVRPKVHKKKTSLCGATGKVCFKSQQRAEEVGVERCGTVLRAYKCPFCGQWHFTKAERR